MATQINPQQEAMARFLDAFSNVISQPANRHRDIRGNVIGAEGPQLFPGLDALAAGNGGREDPQARQNRVDGIPNVPAQQNASTGIPSSIARPESAPIPPRPAAPSIGGPFDQSGLLLDLINQQPATPPQQTDVFSDTFEVPGMSQPFNFQDFFGTPSNQPTGPQPDRGPGFSQQGGEGSITPVVQPSQQQPPIDAISAFMNSLPAGQPQQPLAAQQPAPAQDPFTAFILPLINALQQR